MMRNRMTFYTFIKNPNFYFLAYLVFKISLLKYCRSGNSISVNTTK